MTGNAGLILLITNKGRTIRKLMRGGGGGGGGGGRCTKNRSREGKRIQCTPINLKKIFILRPKKIHTRNLITKKKMIVLFFYFLA